MERVLAVAFGVFDRVSAVDGTQAGPQASGGGRCSGRSYSRPFREINVGPRFCYIETMPNRSRKRKNEPRRLFGL